VHYSLYAFDIDGLGLAVLALADFEGDNLAFVQRPIALHLDLGVMHKQIVATLLGDEAVALVVAEPLHCALRHVSFFLREAVKSAWRAVSIE
jgi:hypothetical protein